MHTHAIHACMASVTNLVTDTLTQYQADCRYIGNYSYLNIEHLRLDAGSQFTSSDFTQHCWAAGIPVIMEPPDPVPISSVNAEYNEGCIAFMAVNHLQMLLSGLESVQELATPIYFVSRSWKPVLLASCCSAFGKELMKGFSFLDEERIFLNPIHDTFSSSMTCYPYRYFGFKNFSTLMGHTVAMMKVVLPLKMDNCPTNEWHEPIILL
jgi:hypothetical protein